MQGLRGNNNKHCTHVEQTKAKGTTCRWEHRGYPILGSTIEANRNNSFPALLGVLMHLSLSVPENFHVISGTHNKLL